MALNKKHKKQLEVIRKKLPQLKQQLAGEKEQMDDPAAIQRIEAEIADLYETCTAHVPAIDHEGGARIQRAARIGQKASNPLTERCRLKATGLKDEVRYLLGSRGLGQGHLD